MIEVDKNAAADVVKTWQFQEVLFLLSPKERVGAGAAAADTATATVVFKV